jgi:hypothetical protein
VKNLVFDKDTGEIFDTGRTLATEKGRRNPPGIGIHAFAITGGPY